MFARLTEPSSWAGIAGAIHALASLLATGGTDPAAWGTLVASIAAVLIPEKSA